MCSAGRLVIVSVGEFLPSESHKYVVQVSIVDVLETALGYQYPPGAPSIVCRFTFGSSIDKHVGESRTVVLDLESVIDAAIQWCTIHICSFLYVSANEPKS